MDHFANAGDLGVTFCATLCDEWASLGVTDVVLSPGSRSTPLAIAVLRNERLNVHMVLDERSAGFVALGLGKSSGVPAALMCTSGTAATEYHSAVVEAHQSAIPMLVVTADRPPELQGVGAPQTIDQRDLFGSAVRWYCEPGPPEPQMGLGWRHMARDAFARTVTGVPGPVHLNLGFREPLVGVVTNMPGPLSEPFRMPMEHPGMTIEQFARLAEMVSHRRGVIVAGDRAAKGPADRDAILALAVTLGWPVLADHLSGCRIEHPNVMWAYDPVLRSASMDDPEVVFRWGGLSSSKVLNAFLAGLSAFQVGIDRYGLIPDPDQVIAERVNGSPTAFCRALAPMVHAAPSGWLDRWSTVDHAARRTISERLHDDSSPGLIEPQVVDAVLEAAVPGAAVVVSSSMPVRDLEWFGRGRSDVSVYANRGANGIDGVTSTAIGVAMNGQPTTVIVGDLAFLHDVSALVWLRDRDLDVQIVVIDNDGGGIFSFLPQATALDSGDFERLYGTPHGYDLDAIASSFGLSASQVATADELRRELVDRTHRVVIARSDRNRNVSDHAMLNDAVAAAIRTLDAAVESASALPPSK